MVGHVWCGVAPSHGDDGKMRGIWPALIPAIGTVGYGQGFLTAWTDACWNHCPSEQNQSWIIHVVSESLTICTS